MYAPLNSEPVGSREKCIFTTQRLTHEKRTIQRSANYRDFATTTARANRGLNRAGARTERGHILRLEKQVRRGERRRANPAQAHGRGKSVAQAAVRGLEFREPSH